jgi:mono/diheme cytochrome c family protein
MTPRTIIVGGLLVVGSVIAVVVLIPALIFKPADTQQARPYTALEAEGRALFVSAGCNYCHSQFTRKEDPTNARPSQAGDFNYDNPHLLGTSRTGPDLANISHKRSDAWEIEHLKDPRKFTPNSIMPSFKHFAQRQLDAIDAYLNRLGDGHTGQWDPMIPAKWADFKNPLPVTVESWAKGRAIFTERCVTCHGCAGNGAGPYSHTLNTRPADLRQSKYALYPDGFYMWRVGGGVPGTPMPKWDEILTQEELQQVTLYEKHAFARPVNHFTDEGDIPAEYANVKDPNGVLPIKEETRTLEIIDGGKQLFIINCSPCHGYPGAGNGPDAITQPHLTPGPPDFRDPEFYGKWKDGDWFWRISESVPMRAMPQWKLVLNEDERWLLATYVRDMLALPKKGREPADPDVPKTWKDLVLPADADYDRGRVVYMRRCSMCHGYGGQGEGIDGTGLIPLPADFTDPELRADKEMNDGIWFTRVSNGIRNSAMPMWKLLLSEEERWDVIRYFKETYFKPQPAKPRPMTAASLKVPEEYAELTNPVTDSGDKALMTYSLARGKELYAERCAECHGKGGQGDGEASKPLTPAGPLIGSVRVKEGGDDYAFYTIAQGTSGTSMVPFAEVLSEDDMWHLVNYVKVLASHSTAGTALCERCHQDGIL